MRVTYANHDSVLIYEDNIITLDGKREHINVGVWPNVMMDSGTLIDARSKKLAEVTVGGIKKFYHLLVNDMDNWEVYILSKRKNISINEGLTKIKVNETEYMITKSFNIGTGASYTCQEGVLFISKETATWNGIVLKKSAAI